MPSISETISRLKAMHKAAASVGQGAKQPSRLTILENFGSNPGGLTGHAYAPEALKAGAPLVVVLHGCTQDAAGYDAGSGWSAMADQYGFAVLYPEQQRRNNPNLCFNWFSDEDTTRGSGEVLSIRQMIAAMVAAHKIDPARIFVTGLSAGGAMTSAMLATYPEVFAGGAIIAGLPYGSANSVPQALERMRGQGLPSDRELAGLVRKASAHTGPWPTISVWHGTADATVNVGNAAAILGQWRGVHGVDEAPDHVETVGGYPHRVWHDAHGRTLLEEYVVTGMGHGTPLATQGADGCGRSGAHMLEVGLSSTRRLCDAWGLADAAPATKASAQTPDQHEARELVMAGREQTASHNPRLVRIDEPSKDAPRHGSPADGVRKVIEEALRSAGLMR